MINDNEKKMCFLFCCISVFLLLVIVVIIFQKNKEKYTPLPTPLSNLIKIAPISEFSTTLATGGNEISISSSSLSLLNPTLTYTPTSNFPILQCMSDGNLLIEINNDSTPVLQTNYQTNTISSGYIIQTNNLNTDLIKSVSTLNEIKLNDTIAGSNNEISIMSSYLNLLNTTTSYTPTSNFPILQCMSDGNLLIEINDVNSVVLQTNYKTNTISSGYIIQTNNLNTDLIKSVSTSNEIKLNDTLAGGGNEISIMSSYLNLLNTTTSYTPSSYFPILQCMSDGNLLIEINNYSGAVLQTNYQKNTMLTSLNMTGPSFTSPSDYRLKQDIIPIRNPLERCLKLKPKNYRMIGDVEKGNNNECEGFIAHEVQDIIPSAVLGEKDDKDIMQSINYSGLTPLLTGSIQELYKIIQNQNQIIEKQGNDIKELYNIINKL